MNDLQVIVVKDVVPIRNIDFVSTLLVRDVAQIAAIVAVYVNQFPTQFMRVSATEIAIPVPNEVGGLAHVQEISLVRTLDINNPESSNLENEIIEGGVVLTPADTSARISVLNSVLYVRGDDFSQATEVWINKRKQSFTLISQTELLASFPALDGVVDTVEVISTSKTTSRRSFFAYQLGELRAINGPMKVIQQFVKLLLTTPGSDAFDPDAPAVGLRKWISKNLPAANPQSVLAQIIISVQTAGTIMIAQQAATALPPNERLATVQVVGADTNPENPSSLNLVIKLTTLSRESFVFSTLLGTINEIRAAAES